jgi:hypothetical protein
VAVVIGDSGGRETPYRETPVSVARELASGDPSLLASADRAVERRDTVG